MASPARERTVRFRELVEEARVGIYVSTPGGRLEFCNATFARLLGFVSAADAVGSALEMIYESPAERDRFVERVRLARHLNPHRTRLRRRDGRVIDVIEAVIGEFDEAGRLVELRGHVVDIGEIVAMEAALRERDAQFHVVFNETADAILILDERRTIVDANAAALALFGLPPGDVGTSTLDRVLPGGAVDEFWPELVALGEVTRKHQLFRGEEARTIECRYRARVRTGRHLCVAREVTERPGHSEKIEPVDRLAGGIAHEFNNLLTAILGYTELLLATRAPGDPDRADLEEVRKAADRAAALTRQLLAFGRKQVLVPRDVDLNALVGGLRQRLGHIVRDRNVLSVEVSPAPALVSVDQVQFEQALMNLVVNARDALTGGGRIVLSLARAEVAAGAIDSVPAGRYVRVRVSDDGRGMPPEVRAHLFEPFFTTKEFGKAAGLGLASVHGFVLQSRGHITVDSAPGAGTAVTMYFPSLDVEAHPAAAGPAPATGATILLVEDEEAVRVITSTVLKRAGFRVLEASSPHAACEIFAVHRDTIDLLLTDVVMPEMNGPALAQRLVAERATLRVLFISGYAGVAASAFDPDNPNVAFLSKPFHAQTLVAQVGELLGRRRPA